MKNWVIRILIIIILTFGFAQLGYGQWSKSINIATESNWEMRPVQVLEYAEKIMCGYYNTDERAFYIYDADRNSIRSDKDFKKWLKYDQTVGERTDFNLVKLGNEIGLFWIEENGAFFSINGIILDGMGNILSTHHFVTGNARLRNLFVHAKESNLYLSWVEDDDKDKLWVQLLNYTSDRIEKKKIFQITASQKIFFPRMVTDKEGRLHLVWKNDVWKSGEGSDYNILYTTVEPNGQINDPMFFGHSAKLIGDSILYEEQDVGPELIYDQTKDQVIGIWGGSDFQIRMTFTAPSIAPRVSIIKDGEFVVRDQSVFSAKTIGHHGDLAVDPRGRIFVTWSEQVTQVHQICFGSLFELLQINQERGSKNYNFQEMYKDALEVPSDSAYSAGFPRLIIDLEGKAHLFWWDISSKGSKLIYRNNRDTVPFKALARLGLNPQADDFSLKKVVVHLIFLFGTVIIIGGMYTFLNLINPIIVICIFGGLKRFGFEKIFIQRPVIPLLGMFLILCILEGQWNGFFIRTGVQPALYHFGGLMASLLVLAYWRIKPKKITDMLVMLEILLVWSFWQHLVVVFPVVIQLIG